MTRKSAGYVTKRALDEALESIAWGKLTFDEMVVLHRVVRHSYEIALEIIGPILL